MAPGFFVVWWGWGGGKPHGDGGERGGEEVWDLKQLKGGLGGAGNGIWSVKNKLQIIFLKDNI